MTVPDEAVEAAAMAAAKDEDASNWHDESEYYRNGWRNRMQVGLTAAAKVMFSDERLALVALELAREEEDGALLVDLRARMIANIFKGDAA